MELFQEGAINFYAENKQTRDSEVFLIHPEILIET